MVAEKKRVVAVAKVGRLILIVIGAFGLLLSLLLLLAKAELEHALDTLGTRRQRDDDTRVGRALCAGWRNSRVLLLVVRARSLTRIGCWRAAHASTEPRIRRILIGTWPDPTTNFSRDYGQKARSHLAATARNTPGEP